MEYYVCPSLGVPQKKELNFFFADKPPAEAKSEEAGQ